MTTDGAAWALLLDEVPHAVLVLDAIGTILEVRAEDAVGLRLLELIGAPVGWFSEGAVLFSLRDLTAVMFSALDNFKTVNDSLSHSTGDALLRRRDVSSRS